MIQFEQTNETGRGCLSEAVFDLNHCFGDDFFWKKVFERLTFLVFFFPQIAIAIGVLTSNRGGGRRTTLAHWTRHQGAIAGCSGRGAIAGCHRRVPL